MLAALQRTLQFIRFSHTVFALPFALGSMLVAARGLPNWSIVLLILLAMVFARTAAMAFNRVADWEMDKLNPRTAGRHKLVSKPAAYCLVGFSALAFLVTCWFINPLCFVLSPIALAIVFFYSFTKRFTPYTQFFLGLSLAIAPVGAWLAVCGHFAWPPVILAIGVIFWVGGFDLIYATQDYEFDRKQGLHSMVVRFGVPASLRIAQFMHGALLICLLGFGLLSALGWIYYVALLAVAGALFYEHRAAATLDLAGINRAFFQSNAFVGLIFVLAVCADVFVLAK
ncbi:MAG: UbiA family prenyltransferase [Verrucomicrobia bacterium]|nr:UbiA family prenyltransferase [Verrucomicrobiota bacterium]MBV9272400.1 UbiA family prenyltransferase [Verrucomicrobiota bacterium]